MIRIAPYIFQRKPSNKLYFRYRIPKPLDDLTGRSEIKVSLGMPHGHNIKTIKRVGIVAALLLQRHIHQVHMTLNGVSISYGAFALEIDSLEVNHESQLQLEKIISAFHQLIKPILGTQPAALTGATRESQPAVADPAQSQPTINESRYTLRELVDRYIARQKKNWSEGTLLNYQGDLNTFLEVLELHSEDIRYISQLNDDIAEFVLIKLQECPKNRNKKAKFRDLHLRQAIETALEDELMSPSNVNKIMGRVTQMFDYAIKANWQGVEKNYFTIHRVDTKSVQKAKKNRVNLGEDELKTLFNSEEYTRSSFKYAYQYWVPLLLLYSGARVQEICQLHCHDIKRIDGLWVLDINENSATKRTKTSTSNRQVPIHQELIDLGFLDFVNKIRDKYGDQNQLFIDLSYTSKHGYARKYQRWSLGEGTRAGYFQKVGLKGEALDRNDNHAFRHTLTSALQDRGVPQELRSSITGHKMKNSGENATYSHSQMLKLKQEALEKISFKHVAGKVKPFYS